MFVDHGYDATTVDQIAEAADISRATFFNYFVSKVEVVQTWVRARRAHVGEGLQAASGHDAAARLRLGLADVAALYDHDHATSRAMVRAWLRCGGPLLPGADDTSKLLKATIQQGQVHGDLDANLDADAAARALLDIYLGTLYRWSADTSTNDSLAAHLSPAIEPYLSGIQTTAQPHSRDDSTAAVRTQRSQSS